MHYQEIQKYIFRNTDITDKRLKPNEKSFIILLFPSNTVSRIKTVIEDIKLKQITIKPFWISANINSLFIYSLKFPHV